MASILLEEIRSNLTTEEIKHYKKLWLNGIFLISIGILLTLFFGILAGALSLEQFAESMIIIAMIPTAIGLIIVLWTLFKTSEYFGLLYKRTKHDRWLVIGVIYSLFFTSLLIGLLFFYIGYSSKTKK